MTLKLAVVYGVLAVAFVATAVAADTVSVREFLPPVCWRREQLRLVHVCQLPMLHMPVLHAAQLLKLALLDCSCERQ